MFRRLSTWLCAALVVLLPVQSRAQTRDLDLSLSLSSGSSWTGRPQDRAGEPTLLHGSGFAGTTTRLGAGGRQSLGAHNALRLHAFVGWQQLAGFAEVDGTRRDLTFRALNAELLVAGEWTPLLATVSPLLAVAAGPRIGLWASATERRTGIPESEAAPAVRTGIGLPLTLEAGVRIQLGSRRLDAVLFGAWNALYPSTTRRRLRGYQNVNQPGSYRPDSDFDVGILATLWI